MILALVAVFTSDASELNGGRAVNDTNHGHALEPDEIDSAVRTERLKVYDYLDGLGDFGWTVQSLCSAWKRRWHVTGQTRVTTTELVEQLRESADSSRRPVGSGPMDPLLDLLVHGQDIARPPARPYEMRTDLALPAPAYVAPNRFLGGTTSMAGLELIATVAEWSTGEGPAVRGTAENLLLGGRRRRDTVTPLRRQRQDPSGAGTGPKSPSSDRPSSSTSTGSA